MAKRATKTSTNGGANLGFEATLGAAADKLLNKMDAAEHHDTDLGLITSLRLSKVKLLVRHVGARFGHDDTNPIADAAIDPVAARSRTGNN